MGGGSSKQVFECPPGQWTRVMYGGGLIWRTYHLSFSAAGQVQWRRYSGGPPWYIWGTYQIRDPGRDTENITISPTDIYVQYDINPDKWMKVAVTY